MSDYTVRTESQLDRFNNTRGWIKSKNAFSFAELFEGMVAFIFNDFFIVVLATWLTNVAMLSLVTCAQSKWRFLDCMDYIRKSHFDVSHYPLPLY